MLGTPTEGKEFDLIVLFCSTTSYVQTVSVGTVKKGTKSSKVNPRPLFAIASAKYSEIESSNSAFHRLVKPSFACALRVG